MIRLVRISAAALSIAAAFCGFASAPGPSEQTAKPWAWFWAMGGAMEERGLSEELELMAESGIGGITLIPIYGAGGDEKNYTELLSPRFMEHRRGRGGKAGDFLQTAARHIQGRRGDGCD